jgi:hypothetical protein
MRWQPFVVLAVLLGLIIILVGGNAAAVLVAFLLSLFLALFPGSRCCCGVLPLFLLRLNCVRTAGAANSRPETRGRTFVRSPSFAPSHEQHTVLHALGLHKRETSGRKHGANR